MAVVSHFLYPLNPNSGYHLVGKGKKLPTSRENFFRVLDYRVLDEWGITQGASAIKKGDFIWVHFAAPDSALYAVGRVAKTAMWNSDWEKYSIKIRWDKKLTERLRLSPIPLSAYGQVPYVSARKANERTQRVLSHWLKGKVSLTAAKRDEEVGFRTTEVEQRVGQPEFRATLLRAYDNTCAITGCRVDEVLEAAHIRPVKKNGNHSIKNGLLLRADLHNLFDRGLVTIDRQYRILLDESIRSAKEYRKLHGQRLAKIPKRTVDRPSKVLLEQHRRLFLERD
jgi:hypothetical protein